AEASQAAPAAPVLDPAAELAAQALRMSGIEPAPPNIPNAAALNQGLLRATQRAARAAETGNAAASAEEASEVPSETADEYARLDAREAELLAEAEGYPPAEVEEAPQPAAASGAAPSAPPAKAPPPHLRAATAGEEAQEGRGTRAPCDEAGDGPVSGPLIAGSATIATIVAFLDAYHMVRPHAQEVVAVVADEVAFATSSAIRLGAVAIATLILAATAAALVGVRWTLSAKSRLFQSGFNAEGNAAAAALQSADAAPPLAAVDTWRLGDLERDERRECTAYVRSFVDQAQAERRSVRVYGLNAAGRALLHQECASRRLSHVTSGDKSFMTFWHEDWSPRKSSEAPASSESFKDQIVSSRSAPELPAAALQAQESPTGALSYKSMRSTNSGGAEFELASLRRECDGLRKALDDSTRREQGLAAQLRAHRVLQEQVADGRVTPLAILDAAPQARAGEANVALHPDSSFLSPLLQLIGDAACVEIMLTAFTYDDPELTSATTAARSKFAPLAENPFRMSMEAVKMG
ncbi:unnamed protein product, partial [Symbiodinium necroappetens]